MSYVMKLINQDGTDSTLASTQPEMTIGTVQTGDTAAASITRTTDGYLLNLVIPGTFAGLSDVHICDTTPTALEEGHWYLVKSEG